jgi:CheY-like chemotaxis protein
MTSSIATFFLIDDDEDDREIFITVLMEIAPQISCSIAQNGHEALTKLVDGEVDPDLIFLDLNMPLMNGTQFLMQINRFHHLKKVPVVILSTSSDSDAKRKTFELGAKEFLTKPDKLSDWENMLREQLLKFNFIN